MNLEATRPQQDADEEGGAEEPGAALGAAAAQGRWYEALHSATRQPTVAPRRPQAAQRRARERRRAARMPTMVPCSVS